VAQDRRDAHKNLPELDGMDLAEGLEEMKAESDS
jgi:hypothetical protein